RPTRALTVISGPSMRPQPKYPSDPSKVILQRVRIPTPSEWRACGLRTTTSGTASSSPKRGAPREVDRARRQVLRVEGGDAALDDGGPRRLRERLGEPAGVVRDLPFAY